jgi:peptidoglycan hydrolase-like protein with peptidoglycan-binding domain
MRLRSSVSPLLALLLLAVSTVVTVPAWAAAGTQDAQMRLNGLGCEAGVPDGVVDTRFRTAVLRFQAANRLTQSGRLDAGTRSRLRAAQARRCDVRPVPSDSGSGRRIVISQRQNWVWLVRAGGGVQAQGGMVDEEWLPRDTYRTGAYCGRPARSRVRTDYTGRLLLRNFVRFAPCGVGFHQIPVRRSTGRQIHADWYVGTDLRASHGCIRLARPMIRAVWRFTVSRTRVVVVGG